jgi:hypothetical protein
MSLAPSGVHTTYSGPGTVLESLLLGALFAGWNLLLTPSMREFTRRKADRQDVRSLTSSTPAETDPDASRTTEVLAGTPGARKQVQESVERARRGETLPLSEL